MLEMIVVEEFIEKIRNSQATICCKTTEETRRIIEWLISVGCMYQGWGFDEDEMPIIIWINPFLHAVDAWDYDDEDSLCDWFERSNFEVPQIVSFDNFLNLIGEHENKVSDILADLPAELI